MAKAPTKTRKARVPVNPDETKRQRFVRLANARINKSVRAINQIEKLASKSGYDFSADDAQALIDALDKSVNGVRAAFEKALAPKPSAVAPITLIGE